MATPENNSFLDELVQRSNALYPALKFAISHDSWREAVIADLPSRYKASYRYRASQNDAAVTFELNGDDASENTRFFNRIEQHKEAIESALGVKLEWRDSDDDLKLRRMVRWEFKNLGYGLTQAQARNQQTLIDAMMRFDGVLRPYLVSLQTV